MTTEPAETIINFMKIVEQLCMVKRDNLLHDGQHESDADHIIKLCWLVMLVTPYLKIEVDYAKMLEMALVHDLVEAYGGDFSLSAQQTQPELKLVKKQKEQEAILHYRKLLPPAFGEKIYNLFQEYEERQTRESQIVWVLDKIEANLQANRYHDGDVRYWRDCPGGEWYYQCTMSGETVQKERLAQLNEDVLLQLENLVMELCRCNIKKCGIKVS